MMGLCLMSPNFPRLVVLVLASFSEQFRSKDYDIFDSTLGKLVPKCDKVLSSSIASTLADGLRLTQSVWSKTENLLRNASHVLGTAEHFLSAVAPVLKDSSLPPEVKPFLLQVDNCTLSKRSEILDKAKVSDNLKDALIKSPLDEKIFGLPLDEVQKHLNQTPAPVKVNVSLSGNNSKRGSYSSAGGSSYNSQEKRRKITNDGEVETLLTKRAVEEVPVSSIDPGFYSRLFLVSKKTGGMRPVIDLSILNSYMIIPHFKMETNRSIRASILPGYSDSFLPGRLTDQGTFSRETLSQYRCSHQIVSLSGVSHFLEKVGPHSVSGLYFPRRTLPYSSVHSSTSSGKVSESLFKNSSVSISKNSYCSPVFTTARSLEFTSGCCSTWSPSHSTSSILSTSTLAPSYTGLGISSSNHSSGIVSSFGLVDFSSKRFERPTSVLSSSKSDSVHRCLQPRLGSLSGRSFSVRSVDSRSFEGTHQHTRNEGSSSCTVSFSVNKSLVLATDNTTVVAYLRNQGGTHCYELYLLAREILLLCNHLHLQIVVRHVPGKLNVLADALSRTLTPVNTEWELLQSVFQAITLQWGSPHVDLFATSLNYKVQVFMSPVPDPKAYAVDCMSVPWDGMFAYAFPPFRFLSQVLRKISAEQGLIILIAPAWPKQAWFPDLLHLSCARPLVLPVRHNLLSQDKSSVTLLTDPAFLAKNQIPGRGSEPIVIPALPDDSSSKVLCPIRVLLLYLQRTRSLRTSSNSRLFIPINKGKQDLSAKTISTWICKTIQLAYSFSNEELLNSMHVKAHDVRAISTSWALFNNASLEEVLSAGFWRTENSFISHYLQSLATQAQSLYSLGPLVSAQRVVFPPASSGSGDSALC
ncbi:unnamed protein product [Mytilus edulis]|uniref:Uncharacterized protein n=1 Tax=Mytilus edulis TaxID=6550 RepID=A0A8S3S7S6_MYTED|nr:unnamed protein product [Mytilus edulis]